MNRILLIPAFLIILLFSCDENTSPEDVIERDVFIEILADIQVFKSTDQFIRNKRTEFDLDSSYAFILNKYEISEEEFSSSLNYYSSDPERFEKIYDEVIIKLTTREVEYTK